LSEEADLPALVLGPVDLRALARAAPVLRSEVGIGVSFEKKVAGRERAERTRFWKWLEAGEIEVGEWRD
jgi:hypothetical protein